MDHQKVHEKLRKAAAKKATKRVTKKSYKDWFKWCVASELSRFSKWFPRWHADPAAPFRIEHDDGSSISLNGGVLELVCEGWKHFELIENDEEIFETLVDLEKYRLALKEKRGLPFLRRVRWVRVGRSHIIFTRSRKYIQGMKVE